MSTFFIKWNLFNLRWISTLAVYICNQCCRSVTKKGLSIFYGLQRLFARAEEQQKAELCYGWDFSVLCYDLSSGKKKCNKIRVSQLYPLLTIQAFTHWGWTILCKLLRRTILTHNTVFWGHGRVSHTHDTDLIQRKVLGDSVKCTKMRQNKNTTQRLKTKLTTLGHQLTNTPYINTWAYECEEGFAR